MLCIVLPPNLPAVNLSKRTYRLAPCDPTL